MSRRSAPLPALLLLLLPACGDGSGPAGADPDPGPDPSRPAAAGRFAAHRFAPVGTALEVDGLGELLEVGSLVGTGVVERSGSSLRCASGGVGFARLRYRDDSGENGVQTKLFTCVDAVGPCDGLPPVSLDLERSAASRTGDADLFAQGSNRLWGLCRDGAAVRLQRPAALPPLVYRVVDAWGRGPYSIGAAEYPLMRGSSVVGYGGAEATPAWYGTVGHELSDLSFSGGTLAYRTDECAASPGCPEAGSVFRAGDFVSLSFGVVDLPAAFAAASAEDLAAFVAARVPIDWAEATSIESADLAAPQIVYRLVGMEVMEDLLAEFDAAYGLRAAGAHVGFTPFWQTRYRIGCLPHEREVCERYEAALDAWERERIAALRAGGFDLWHDSFVAYDDAGDYVPRREQAPSWDAFAGVIGILDGGAPTSAEPADALEAAVRGLAAEIGSTPLLIGTHWGPMRHGLEGEMCEAEICAAAFSDYFAAFEPAVAAVLESFPAGQVRGLFLPMFDAAHFDLSRPHETLGGVALNRAAETGWNNPLMNLYYAR